MITKLTLTVEKDIIDLAKDYASKQGTSLSGIIENYLKLLVSKEHDKQLSPGIKKLVGSVKVPDNFDYKKALEEALSDKYSK
jgi:hypothetical protein